MRNYFLEGVLRRRSLHLRNPEWLSSAETMTSSDFHPREHDLVLDAFKNSNMSILTRAVHFNANQFRRPQASSRWLARFVRVGVHSRRMRLMYCQIFSARAAASFPCLRRVEVVLSWSRPCSTSSKVPTHNKVTFAFVSFGSFPNIFICSRTTILP